MSGDKISDMTLTSSLPAGTFFPLVVTDAATGLNPSTNYRYDAGLRLATYAALSANGGAALIGTSAGITVQAALNASVSLAALAASGGSALVGFIQDGAGAVLRTVQDKLRDYAVSVADFRASGATDDNDAFEEALATGRPVYLPGGMGAGGSGQYLIETANGTSNVPSDAYIFGDGMGVTIIEWGGTASTFPFFIDSGSASLASNLMNITFRDLTIQGAGGAFSQFQHNMWLGGVTNFLAERVEFKAFQGDGCYVGSGNNVGTDTERHNVNVTFRDCIFNGVNNNNRNGISIVDCDGWLIDNCQFINVTKLDGTMPGPIDAEPDDHVFHVVRAGRVTNCRFFECGGALSLLLRPNSYPTTPYVGFEIDNNTFVDCYGFFSFNGFATTGAVAAVTPYGVKVHNNTAIGCTEHIARIDGAFGLDVYKNEFINGPAIEFGNSTGATSRLMDFSGNSFARCGNEGNLFLLVDDTIDLGITKNFFTDCGLTAGGLGRIVYVVGANADVTRLRLDHNKVSNPNTKTTAFAMVVGGYAGTVDSASTKIGNVLPTLGTADTLVLSGVGPDFLQGSATSDVANIVAGRAGTVSITVTGAVVGDYVMSVTGSTALDTGLRYLTGEVTAANTVTVPILNPTAADIDPVSRTYYAVVRKRTL